jgi:hypothetical protein
MRRCPVCRDAMAQPYLLPVVTPLSPYEYEDDYFDYAPQQYLEFCSQACAECHLAMEEANRRYGSVGSGDATQPAGPPRPAAEAA